MKRRNIIEVSLIVAGAIALWYVLIWTGIWSWYVAFVFGVVVGIAVSDGISITDAAVVIFALPVLLIRDFIMKFDNYKYGLAEWKFKKKLGVRNDLDVEVKVQEVLKNDGIRVDRAYIRPVDESGEAEWGLPGIVVDVAYDDAERLKREYGKEWYKVVEKEIANALGIDANRVKVFQAEPEYW